MAKIWKEVVIACFKVPFQNFPVRTEENHKKLQDRLFLG
jgi:hypothetical protein